jgi:cytochrome c oxidase subunit 2
MLGFLQRWLPINASEHGPALDEMTALVHWLMLVLFVGWSLYFLYVLFRFRASANPRASYKGATSHVSQYVEIGVAVVEVVLLVFFAIPAWASWVAPDIDPDNSMEVRVVAEQFLWSVHYPGPDGVFGATDINLITPTNAIGLDRSDPYAVDDVTAINQLHMPVGKDITIYLTSKDVIHSFGLPQMRVKQDIVPGLMIPLHFKPTMVTPIESRFPACNADKNCWEIACAQLCGLGHYRMRGFYTVLEVDEFDAWMAEQVAAVMPAPAIDAAAAPDDDAAAGEVDAGTDDHAGEPDGEH